MLNKGAHALLNELLETLELLDLLGASEISVFYQLCLLTHQSYIEGPARSF